MDKKHIFSLQLGLLALLGAGSWLAACGGSSPYDPGETTAASCTDGIDNDGDGQSDCDDTDCQGFTFCHVPTPRENDSLTCRDGTDNDADGLADCADPDCQGFVFCQEETPTEVTAADCADGQDNDGDGQSDCDDPDCQGFTFCQPDTEQTVADCSDGSDNDGDGLTDCADPDCQGFVGCQPRTEDTSGKCADGLDNDGDGLADCADPDCQGFVFCYSTDESIAVNCSDGLDNDSDGQIDCADADCQGFTFCVNSEVSAAACTDGQDNDADGQVDCADTDCQGYVFCQALENTAAACSDSADNDSDGNADCADPDCQGFTFCLASEDTAAACADGQDNDADGQSDCADTDCQGYVFCLSQETTALACQDGTDNDSDGQADCDDPDCQAFVFCTNAAGESGYESCRDGRDNDGDGQSDCDDDGCWVWAYCNHYHGYPLVDSWGETFDGLERTARTWQEAADTCAALGGRLPTATELWRNNATSGTGDLSADTAANCLWTLLPDYRTGERICVRLSDGNVSHAPETNQLKFRCVWPDHEGSGFDEFRCHGDPGAPCFAYGRLLNADRWDRAPLPYTAAAAECAFYGASIPGAADWTGLIHSGLDNGSNTWLWAGEPMYWYSGGHGAALVRWTDDAAARWQFQNNAWGALSWGYNPRRFRCLGLADPAAWPAPAASCNGGCQDFSARRAPLKADSADRDPADFAAALAACRAEGGWLPAMSDAVELIQAGWLAGSDQWLWLTDSMYWYAGNYGLALARWSGDGNRHYYYVAGPGNPTWGGVSPSAALRPYRCLWRPAGPAVPDCQAGEIVAWDGSGYACQPGAAGSSQGNANVIEIVDDFGNAWDGIQRDLADFASAQATCEALGGRLPRASELYAVRFTGNPHDPIGDVTSTSFLWTTTQVSATGQRALVRVSDGGSSTAPETSSQYFRCIWPARRSEILAAGNCYGPPGAECFRTADGLIADSYDRVALDAAGAANECLAAGGRLPDNREVTALVNDGWPNPSNAWLWSAEFMYWYNNNYGQAVYRFTTGSAPSWSYAPSNGGVSAPTAMRQFRCVYSEVLR